MPKAGDIKKGSVVEINNQIYIVKNIDVQNPSSRGATTLYKMRMMNAQTKQKLEQNFKGDDVLKEVELIRRNVQFSYKEGDSYVFMDTEDYSQYIINAGDLEDEAGYITENLEGIMAMLIDDTVLGIVLPQSVDLEITDTAPAMKGATVTGRTKAAKLSTGLEIQVPEYLAVGEMVKVNTTTGIFMSRA